jgi:hypothetical protein
VYGTGRPEGTVDRAADVFCVLEQFHRHLLRRDIYATPSARWADPRPKLLTGPAWDAARGPALNALGVPEDPGELLAEHTERLGGAWRQLADGLIAGSDVRASAVVVGLDLHGHDRIVLKVEQPAGWIAAVGDHHEVVVSVAAGRSAAWSAWHPGCARWW